jgi:hypothetical protein
MYGAHSWPTHWPHLNKRGSQATEKRASALGARPARVTFSYTEPFLRAVRRGALAKSTTGYHKNMVRKQYPVLELANQMPVRIWMWPELLVASRVRRALGTRMLGLLLWNSRERETELPLGRKFPSKRIFWHLEGT